MSMLNEYCLIRVFECMDLEQQQCIADASATFKDLIYDRIWKSTYKEINTGQVYPPSFSRAQCENFITTVSACIAKLTIPYSTPTYDCLPLELEFYLNLKLPNLIEFDCEDPTMVDSDILILYQNSPKLQILRLSCRRITGKYISNIKQLQKLYFDRCPLKSRELYSILTRLALIHLSFTSNINFTEKMINERSSRYHTGESLQYLTCSARNFNSMILFLNAYKCKKLQKLTFYIWLHEKSFAWNMFFAIKGELINKIEIYRQSNEYDIKFLQCLKYPINVSVQELKMHIFWLSNDDQFVLIWVLREWKTLQNIYLSYEDGDLYGLVRAIINDYDNCQYKRQEKVTIHVPHCSELVNEIKMSEMYKEQNAFVLKTIEGKYRRPGSSFIDFQFDT